MKKCNNEQIYILAYFDGIDRNWITEQPIDFEDAFWTEIQFLRGGKVKLFARPNAQLVSNDELEKEAKTFFFRLYVQHIKKNHTASSPFIFGVLEIQNHDVRQINLKESICVKDEVEVFRFHSDGSPIAPEEFEKKQGEIERKRMQELIRGTLENQICSHTVTKQKNEQKSNLELMEKVLQIADPVLRYCMLYDWLYSLCGRQEDTASFIKRSMVFDELRQTSGSMPPLEKERFNSAKNKNEPEDIFTFCRNTVGHSAADILNFSESQTLGYIDFLIWPLFRILLEKIEGGSSDGQPENANP